MIKLDSFLRKLQNYEELCWENRNSGNPTKVIFHMTDIEDASNRLLRFAPYIEHVFPETVKYQGIIESELTEIPKMLREIESIDQINTNGRLFIKRDNDLPISGSIKARGGIYEVLKFAETIALNSGKLNITDNYTKLANSEYRELFSQYSISVGSTGNLGLSIGIMGAKLGFKTIVHMSEDAKEWKKELLRKKGVTVIEHCGDFNQAVNAGRKEAETDPKCHFVDDESSKDLFLGYSVAALRFKEQLKAQNIDVNAENPLFVYLPCGVGGGPGGVGFGLKMIYGENVNIIFVEPTHSPCMLLGLYTGLHDQISVHDIGIDGKTEADGLAVGKPSKLVGDVMSSLLYAETTFSDDRLFLYLAMLANTENIFIEPSAAAGFTSYVDVNKHLKKNNPMIGKGIHVVWATGGNMVPSKDMDEYYQRGEILLKKR